MGVSPESQSFKHHCASWEPKVQIVVEGRLSHSITCARGTTMDYIHLTQSRDFKFDMRNERNLAADL